MADKTYDYAHLTREQRSTMLKLARDGIAQVMVTVKYRELDSLIDAAKEEAAKTAPTPKKA